MYVSTHLRFGPPADEDEVRIIAVELAEAMERVADGETLEPEEAGEILGRAHRFFQDPEENHA